MTEPKADPLTGPESFSMVDLIATVTAKVEAEDAGDDAVVEDGDGPSAQEGELSDEAPEQETEEVDDTAEDEEEGEDDDSEEQVEEEDPEAEATDPPVDEEKEELKHLVLQGQQQVQALLEQVNALVATQAKRVTQTKEPAISEDLAKLALFEGTPEAWEKLSPADQAKGKKFSKEYIDRETRYALDPDKRYEEQIRDKVMADVQSILKPLMVEQSDRRAQTTFDKYAKGLEDHKQRLGEVFQSMPGSRSKNFSDLEACFKNAAAMVRLELKDKSLSDRERKLQTSDRQKAANKKAAGRRRKRGSGKAPKAKQKGWDNGKQSLFDFAQSMENDGE